VTVVVVALVLPLSLVLPKLATLRGLGPPHAASEMVTPATSAMNPDRRYDRFRLTRVC
jgi:hypothetical protein